MDLRVMLRRMAARVFDILIEAPSADLPLPGLVTLRWTLPRAVAGAWLEVSAPGVATARVPIAEGAASGTVVLHGHLLPDGQHAVTLRCLGGTGKTLGEATRRITLRNPGPLGDAVRASLRRRGVPFAVDICDSALYDAADAALVPWFDRPDAAATIASWRQAGRIDDAEAALLRGYVDDGYLVMQGGIEPDLTAAVNRDIDHAVARRWQGYEWGSSQRIEHLHQHYDAIRRLWLHPRVLRLLELVFQARALPCQTLTYVFGSQQDAHQDGIHLTPFPDGYMCGVWVALEDVQPGSGELEIWPGSHRLDRVRLRDTGCAKVADDWTEFGRTVVPRWRRMLDEGGFRSMLYRPQAGDVLIWHENLMHGGSVRTDPTRSRRSIVSHVFAEGALAYYDSSGRAGYMEPGAA